MDQQGEWIDVGAAEDFKRAPLREAKLGERLVAVSFKDGKFGVISNVCNHVGGPLGKGRLDGEFVVCPWHQYKFHRCTGEGEPGYEADKVPGYGVKEENGRLLVTAKPTSKRGHLPHEPHPLTRSDGTRARAACASAASPPPPWTRRTRASRPPNICWAWRSSTRHPRSARRRS